MTQSIDTVADTQSYPCHACGGMRKVDHGPGCECQCEVLIAKETVAVGTASPTE